MPTDPFDREQNSGCLGMVEVGWEVWQGGIMQEEGSLGSMTGVPSLLAAMLAWVCSCVESTGDGLCVGHTLIALLSISAPGMSASLFFYLLFHKC